jgi:DNA-binding MarR family transcriptional regulator
MSQGVVLKVIKTKNNMENKNDKDVKKLLMALLVSRGISATTIGKIMGVTQANVSQMIPVSDIQSDIKKKHEKK